MILVDTGPLVALGNEDERWHGICRDFFLEASSPLLVPPTVIAETCYMLQHGSVGTAMETRFLRFFRDGVLTLVDLELDDLDRMAELVEQYGDWPLGGTDASIVAIAERLGVTDIATLDRRHFRPIQPRHVGAFHLLPDGIDA